MFHSKNGLFFERLKDGMVRIVKTVDGMPPSAGNVLMDDVLEKASFASVVASMSMSGETADNYHRVLDLLSK